MVVASATGLSAASSNRASLGGGEHAAIRIEAWVICVSRRRIVETGKLRF